MSTQNNNNLTVICADILDFIDDPAKAGENAHRFFEKGALVIKNSKVVTLGYEQDILPGISSSAKIIRHDGKLVMPGMIDTHIHLPQTEMVGAYGEQLLSWLTEYAFPTEKKFACEKYASEVSNLFLDELLRNGTTTALVFGTVHPQSVNAFFSESQKRNLRMIAGKVMMDRNCPDDLSDCAQTSYDETKALIEKWHNVDRLSYAVTPRFAPTSSPEQLHMCTQLLEEYPDTYLHTHLSENKDECEWVKSLFPDATDYLGVYEQANMVRKRAVFAHSLHLSERELCCLADNNAAISHCPTSNLFLGSGLLNLKACEDHNINVGMGTDVGAGTSFSMLQTGSEAYKIQQLQGQKFSAFKGLYLATLGGARALDLEGTIGNFEPGCEADFIVIDFAATSFLKFRLGHAKTLHEKLFAIMMLGDDRCIEQTYIMGKSVYKRDLAEQFTPTSAPILEEA
ncbi:guanine deaminase [Pseudoalteromonas sp. SWXJZ94C]|uniref:guanine deaminase n=1 Tax=Pseudoalteromonas sp. SWXJZ94C TaxID=2792065 RepID=UPI0018CE398A|nr:guanine deaminase [Pseudoalteromonas sp. SWXJZ94C]MBH0058900.1 guanine deaminase [Pseudoalteromonas sp. SWXJZ94C]